MTGLARSIGAFLVLVLAAGCSGMLGRTSRSVTSVRGKLHVSGQALHPGWVEFWPVEGTVGNMRAAKLAADGTFAATRVPVGRVLVRFVPSAKVATGDLRLDRLAASCMGFDSPVRIMVPDRPDWLDIDIGNQEIR